MKRLYRPMTKIAIRSDDGSKLARVEVPEPDGRPSCVAIAFHKSGSVMLDTILRRLCAATGRSYVRHAAELFNQGFRHRDFANAIAGLMQPQGFVFGVFRDCGPALRSLDRAIRKIVLIRDPRDAVVSYYYSVRDSHPIPESGQVSQDLHAARAHLQDNDINRAILGMRFHYLFVNMEEIANLIELPNTAVYRYEEVVFDKAAWIGSLASELSVSAPEAVVQNLLRRVDIFPEAENPRQHIRKVTPGDYKEKLAPETIRFIEERYGSLLRTLGYV
jgi:sulfotransferase family protein